MNYAEIEPTFVEYLRTLPVAQRLRAVETLPELSEDALVKQFGQDAPAVYVSVGPMRATSEHEARHNVSLMLVARNASGYAGPRRADARAGEGRGAAGLIGLNEMLGHLVPHLHLAEVGGVDWQFVEGGALLEHAAMWRQGLYATVLQLQSDPVAIESPVDPSSLDDFYTFSGTWDLGPEPDGQTEARDRVNVPGPTGDTAHQAAHDLVRGWPDYNDSESDAT